MVGIVTPEELVQIDPKDVVKLKEELRKSPCIVGCNCYGILREIIDYLGL